MSADRNVQPTFEQCIVSAKRLLEFAEAEVDLAKMERFEKLADSWMTLAHVLMTKELA